MVVGCSGFDRFAESVMFGAPLVVLNQLVELEIISAKALDSV